MNIGIDIDDTLNEISSKKFLLWKIILKKIIYHIN